MAARSTTSDAQPSGSTLREPGEGTQAPPVLDFQALLESSLDMICQSEVSNGKHQFVYATPSTTEILGWSVEEFLRLPLTEIYAESSLPVIFADAEKLAQGKLTSTVVVEAIRKDGGHVWLENKVRLLEKRADGMSVVICSRDITRRKRLEERLEQLAMLDGLTGIRNRRAFDEAIAREWKIAFRARAPLSLLLLDVDNFKLFNDTYGHLEGDDCLRAIAKAVSGAVKRSTDVVARYGGEEFAVLLPATEMAGAESLARRLCNAVTALNIPHRASLCASGVVSVSCGVSTATGGAGGPAGAPESLLLAADAALYQAKRQGKNRVAVSGLSVRTESGD